MNHELTRASTAFVVVALIHLIQGCAGDALIGVDADLVRGELAEECTSGIARPIEVMSYYACPDGACSVDLQRVPAYWGEDWIEQLEVFADGSFAAAGRTGKASSSAYFGPDGDLSWRREHPDLKNGSALQFAQVQLSVSDEYEDVPRVFEHLGYRLWCGDAGCSVSEPSPLPEVAVLGSAGEPVQEPLTLRADAKAVYLKDGVIAEVRLRKGSTLQVRGLSLDGAELWSKTFPGGGSVLHVQALPGGDLAVVAGEPSVRVAESSGLREDLAVGRLLRMSSEGEVLWQRRERVAKACPDLQGTAAGPDDDNTQVVIGSDDVGGTLLMCARQIRGSKHTVASLRVNRFAPDGELAWQYSTDVDGWPQPSLAVIGREVFVLVGRYRERRSNGSFAIEYVILRLDEHGHWCGDYAVDLPEVLEVPRRADGATLVTQQGPHVHQLVAGRDGQLYGVDAYGIHRFELEGDGSR